MLAKPVLNEQFSLCTRSYTEEASEMSACVTSFSPAGVRLRVHSAAAGARRLRWWWRGSRGITRSRRTRHRSRATIPGLGPRHLPSLLLPATATAATAPATARTAPRASPAASARRASRVHERQRSGERRRRDFLSADSLSFVGRFGSSLVDSFGSLRSRTREGSRLTDSTIIGNIFYLKI